MLKTMIIWIYFTAVASAMSFNNAVLEINKHQSLRSLNFESNALLSLGDRKGSWGDPVLRIMAKNFPKDSLDDDLTPMTGIEFGLAQKISLTTKHANINQAYTYASQSKQYESSDKKQSLLKVLWGIVILSKKITKEIKILTENINWISKTIQVSKNLYSNGKISQQALFEIQIRKSETQIKLNNKKSKILELQAQLNYLIGHDSLIEDKSIPWHLLTVKNVDVKDLKKMSLQENLKSKQSLLTASKLNYVPDVTVSIGYIKRSNIDDQGDFVSAGISFPLPFSSTKYSQSKEAIQNKNIAVSRLENYLLKKKKRTKRLQINIQRINAELVVLKNKLIKFAENSREITLKAYSLGRASYLELLQSEMKLQEFLLKETNLVS
ncbi:MAG: TolC family protein, partial [Halobacteriovoraceae bacterium]|nr:TolC family protein [Halobacteriovoraceae bacterium]